MTPDTNYEPLEPKSCCAGVKIMTIVTSHINWIITLCTNVTIAVFWFRLPEWYRCQTFDKILTAVLCTTFFLNLFFGIIAHQGVKKVKPSLLLPSFIFHIVIIALAMSHLIPLIAMCFLTLACGGGQLTYYGHVISDYIDCWLFWTMLIWCSILLGLYISFASILMKCYRHLVSVKAVEKAQVKMKPPSYISVSSMGDCEKEMI